MENEHKNTVLYVVMSVVFIGILGAGYLYIRQKSLAYPAIANPLPAAGPSARGAGPISINAGMNLKDSPIFQYAYQIVPVDASVNTKQALIGFTITTVDQSDGSKIVTFTPKDSEDQKQVYTVASGQTLYFIEQNPGDDQADQDKDLNYRDDYGIIVDANGIVQ